jgi:hypothetical protein
MIMDPFGRVTAIVKQVMATSDAHQGKTDGHMETTEMELTTEQKTEFLKAVKEILAKMMTQVDTNHEKMMARMDAHHKIIMATLNARHEETVTCQVMTETCQEKKKPNPDDVETGAERREVPKKHAVVRSSGIMKKRQRGRNLAAGRRIKPEDLNQGDCGSRGKLAAACRKVCRHAAVAWHRRNIFRDIRTKEIVDRGRNWALPG